MEIIHEYGEYFMEIKWERTINHGDSSLLKSSCRFLWHVHPAVPGSVQDRLQLCSWPSRNGYGLSSHLQQIWWNQDRQVKPKSKNTLKLSLKMFEGLFNFFCACFVQIRKVKPDEAMDHFDLACPWPNVKCCMCVSSKMWGNSVNQWFRLVPAVKDEHEVDLLIFRRCSSLGAFNVQSAEASVACQKFHRIPPSPLNLYVKSMKTF